MVLGITKFIIPENTSSLFTIEMKAFSKTSFYNISSKFKANSLKDNSPLLFYLVHSEQCRSSEMVVVV